MPVTPGAAARLETGPDTGTQRTGPGIADAPLVSVNTILTSETVPSAFVSPFQYRLRLYGFCVVVALAFMFLGRTLESTDGWVTVYLPLTAATLLVVGLAGVEFQIYLQTVAAEKQLAERKRQELELQAVERQHTFNNLWQALADNRGAATIPADILRPLAELFSADLVAVWSADPAAETFTLRGTHPLPSDGAVRLDKVAHMSPCFDRLRDAQHLLCVTDIEHQTTKAFAWFCEEHGYTQVILCPILVRRATVGVLVFFYRDTTALPPLTLEEMQSAANLFLCAL